MSSRSSELSRTLAWLLRHAATREGLTVHDDGYVYIDEILRHRRLIHSYNINDIHHCIENDKKNRYGLKIDESSGREMIRAHQGHSLEAAASINMTEITDPTQYPIVVHGTYLRFWPSIREQGLSKMSRLHVHFATGLPKQSGVISGMRSNVQLYIYIDLEKALKDGLKFYVSENNVILCPGDERGLISPRYFRSVQKSNGEILYPPTTD